MKKLLSSYPHLVKEWHPTKNGDLTPNDVTHGVEKKAEILTWSKRGTSKTIPLLSSDFAWTLLKLGVRR